MSSNLLKYISPAMLLASSFWVSEASAISVPYQPDSKAATGMINFPPLAEKPFASVLHPTMEQQPEIQHVLQDNERDRYHWDKHPNHGDGHDAHGDQNDDPEDDASTTPIPPPVLSNHPTVTSSTSAVPVPAALWLLLSGIIGLGVAGKSLRR